MAGRHFGELLKAQWQQGRFLCVGLDTDVEKIPESIRQGDIRETMVAFNRAIIDATKDIVCAYKPNIAFYEARGDVGWRALRETIQYCHEQAPDVPVILDAKRGDMGNTNNGYVEAVFDHLKADAVTVQPLQGREALEPFLAQKEKGIIVLCRTSNPGSEEFQNLKVDGVPLYQIIAQHVAEEWNTNGNCSLVVGATYPEEMKEVRAIAPDLPFLVPGIGAQNGDLKKSVQYGKDAKGTGLIITTSRAVIFASSGKDFAEAARAKSQAFNREITEALVE